MPMQYRCSNLKPPLRISRSATVLCSFLAMLHCSYSLNIMLTLFHCTDVHYTVTYEKLLSYSMIVLYNRDHKGVGVAHETISPNSNLNFPRQHWLGNTKPKKAFRSTRNAFNKSLRNFFYKKII